MEWQLLRVPSWSNRQQVVGTAFSRLRVQSRNSPEITTHRRAKELFHLKQFSFDVTFFGLLSSIRTSSNSQVNKLTLSGSDSVILGDTTNGASDEEDGQPRRAVDNEKEGVQYNYSFFHLMLCCASLYIMMTITSWYR